MLVKCDCCDRLRHPDMLVERFINGEDRHICWECVDMGIDYIRDKMVEK